MRKFNWNLIIIFSLAVSICAFSSSAWANGKDDKKEKKTGAKMGALKVKTEGGSYPVYIDGKQVGMTSGEEVIIEVPPGQHTIEIRFSKEKAWTKAEYFSAGRPICLCFKKVTRTITTSCPHLVTVSSPDIVSDGDLVTFTSNVEVQPNPTNNSASLVRFNEFTNVVSLATKLREGRGPAQCVYDRLSQPTRNMIESVSRSSSQNAFLLRADDFKNSALLALKLRASQDAVSTYLRERLSSQTRKLLSRYDGSAAVSNEMLAALLADLNNIINGDSIYAPERFREVALSPEANSLLRQTLSGESIQRLNRALLEDAYPTEIGHIRTPTSNLDLANALAEELNLLIIGPSLRDVSCFGSVTKSEVTKVMAEKNLSSEALKSFNRLLLEDAFPGELAQVRSIYGTSNAPVRYVWTISPSNARIVGPSDRDSITVDTTGFGNQKVSAVLTIDDGRDDNLCRQMNQASTFVKTLPIPPKKRKFDEFPSIAFDDDKARFDAFAVELLSSPNVRGYMIVYSGVKSKSGQADKLSKRSIDYLTLQRGVDASRFMVTTGGYRDTDHIELWILEEGAELPKPTPTAAQPLPPDAKSKKRP
jgi:hypothetical protein